MPASELGDDATPEAAERAREALLTQCGTQPSLLAGAALLLLEPQHRTAEAWFGAAAIPGATVWQFVTERGREDRAEVCGFSQTAQHRKSAVQKATNVDAVQKATNAHARTHTRTHACAHKQTHKHTNTHTHTRTHTCLRQAVSGCLLLLLRLS